MHPLYSLLKRLDDNASMADLNTLNIFHGIKEKMSWLSQRQRVLSRNIAHANTPGYVPKDIEDFSFEKALQKHQHVSQKATHSAHLVSAQSKPGAKMKISSQPYEASPDGNAVVLEEQMIKASDTAIQHKVAANLYTKSVGLIRIALGQRR